MANGKRAELDLEQFVRQTLDAGSLDRAFALLIDAVAALGFDRVLFASMAEHEGLPLERCTHNYPEDFLQACAAAADTDPVRLHLFRTDRAFPCRQLLELKSLRPLQRQLLEQGDRAGLRDRVAVPIRGSRGNLAHIEVASSAGGVDTGPLTLSKLTLVAHQFHVALTVRSAMPTPPAIKLSETELQVLTWSARGKTKAQISQLMAASPHTIDYHQRRLLEKLDAKTMAAAVVNAVRLNLLPV